MIKNTYIYALANPVNNDIRYIGKSFRPFKRLYRHINDTKPSCKKDWIDSLISKGIRPVAIKIDLVPENEWAFWEKHYISLFKSWGFNLTNQTEGGFSDNKSESARKKLSIGKMGKTKQMYLLIPKRKPAGPMKGSTHFASKKIVQLDLQGNKIKEWESANMCASELKLRPASVQDCLHGKRTDYKNFIFKYV